MRICILGATSQIALDFISSADLVGPLEISAYSRKPAELRSRFHGSKTTKWVSYDALSQDGSFDLILNFVGVTSPVGLNGSLVKSREISQHYDDLALNKLAESSSAKYIYLSSGAAYGYDFNTPASEATIPSRPSDAYGLIKFEIEDKHRKHQSENIIDLRIFSYFNRSSDLNKRYFATDLAKALLGGTSLETSGEDFWRDYIDGANFLNLVMCLAKSSAMNSAVDAFSKEPVSKIQLLEHLRAEFGLDFKIVGNSLPASATGLKPMYFSTNYAARNYGYEPSKNSLEIITDEMRALLSS